MAHRVSPYRIPFNKASLTGKELAYITEAVAAGHISGAGPFTHKCETLLEQQLGTARVFLTTSCTHALELGAMLLDVRDGDEVIMPSFTFVSTANAFALHGARPVFCDVRPDTLTLDPAHLARLVGPRTKAIVPVHYAGVGCDMDEIDAVARPRGIAVFEDNAHGLFGRYHGRWLGTLGNLGALSFHETKNLTCGEGGALLVNDPALVERAEILREKGTDRARFFRGAVEKYQWIDVGSSYLLSDLLAAFLYAQLESVDTIQATRRQLWTRYAERLADWAGANGVRLPHVPADREQTYHAFFLILPDRTARTQLIDHLKRRGILAVFHYLPLHLSPMGQRFGGAPGDCPVSEDVSDRLLRLPFYTALTPDEQESVCTAIEEVRFAGGQAR